MTHIFPCNNKLILAPSLISCCDFCHLEKDLLLMKECGIDVLHIDIIDGHFSPSMPLGLETVRQIRKITNLAFDVHLMTTNNEFFVDELLQIGVEQIVFHTESERHPEQLLTKIHSAGVRAGLAVNPGTSLTCLDYLLDSCDTVLLMLINPGYASNPGEKQISYKEKKIKSLRRMIDQHKAKTLISLDGRVSQDDLREFGCGLAQIFVVGSTCIPQGNLTAGLNEIQQLQKHILNNKEIHYDTSESLQ